MLWEVFLEGYQRKRPLLEGYARLLDTFGAMQMVAAVNKQLGLLAHETTRYQARGPRFLRYFVVQLENTYLQNEG